MLLNYHIYQDLTIVVFLFCYREVDLRQSQHVSGRDDASSPGIYSKMVTTVVFSSAWACIIGIIPTTVALETPHAA